MIVNFSARWCSLSSTANHLFEQMAEEHIAEGWAKGADGLRFVTVHLDKERAEVGLGFPGPYFDGRDDNLCTCSGQSDCIQ